MSDFDRSDDRSLTEKFTPTDAIGLRTELLQSGLDTFQAAEIVVTFMNGRGYGICSQEARRVASTIEGLGCTTEQIQAELERVARVM